MAFQVGAFQEGAFQVSNTGAIIVTETGDDSFAGGGTSTVTGIIAANENGEDGAAFAGAPAITGTMSAVESGDDVFFGEGTGLLPAFQPGAFQIGAFQTLAPPANRLDAVEVGNDVAFFIGGPIASGALVVAEVGTDRGEFAGVSVVSGIMAIAEATVDLVAMVGVVDIVGFVAAVEAGADSANFAGTAASDGALNVREIGDDSASFGGTSSIYGHVAAVEATLDVVAITGILPITGGFVVVEAGADSAGFIGSPLVAGSFALQEEGEDSGVFTGRSLVEGVLAPVEAGADQAAIVGLSTVPGTLAAVEANEGDVPNFAGQPIVAGTLAATEQGADNFAGQGNSEGYTYIVPRDASKGISYLIELDAYDMLADEETTLYFSSIGFNTSPTDSLPNQPFTPAIKEPGNYERALFSQGTTHGQISVGAGYIELVNDGQLDGLRNYAFDGYSLRIRTVDTIRPSYDDAVLVFEGTTEQVELSWFKATVRLRDRLAELDVPLQSALFAGTTIAGGMNEAEGRPDDLKGRPKPMTWGEPQLVPALAANIPDRVYAVGQNGLSSIAEVRDRGVALTAMGANYTTVAALRAATISAGYYATALNLGLVRTGSVPAGQLTVKPVEGASTGLRSAAQIARRMLLAKGFVEGTDFLASDVAALDALNSAPLGYWVGADETQTLTAVQEVLGSIGATIMPDRLGIFRMIRFGAPTAHPPITLTRSEILESGRGIQMLATGDQGRGVPAWRVNMRYARNYSVLNRNDLAAGAPDAFKAFAGEEWRLAVAEAPSVKAAHRLSPELTFDSYFINEADAQAEADRQLALHSVRRDRLQVPVKSFVVEQVDLGTVVRLELNRFGLDAGKSFMVIGMGEKFSSGVTTLDLWG